MSTMENLDYIDSYFRGTLTPEEKQQFNQRIIDDAPFAEEVTFYLSSLEAVRMQSADASKQRFRELYNQSAVIKKITPLKKIWPYLAAAAAIIGISLLLTVFLGSPTPPQLAAEYIDKNLNTLELSMGPADSMQQAASDYNNGLFAEALQQFETISKRDTSNTNAKLLAGTVSLKLQQYDKAIAYFKQLEANTNLYSNPSFFFHALTLLKRNQPGDEQEARKLLQYVVEKNLDYKQVAEKWLTKF